MFAFCADPKTLEGLSWLVCYLTTAKHGAFYLSFGTVLLMIGLAAPTALLFGFGGALASRSSVLPVRWFGSGYIAMVRGVPDIVFFLFVPIALDQFFELNTINHTDGPERTNHTEIFRQNLTHSDSLYTVNWPLYNWIYFCWTMAPRSGRTKLYGVNVCI